MVRPALPAVTTLRSRYEQRRTDRLTTVRHVREALVSLAGLVGRPVLNQRDSEIGTVADVVARWDNEAAYPPVTGMIIRVGRRRAWVAVDSIGEVRHDRVILSSARVDLRDFASRAGEVELAREVVDHQLVDTEGARVVRASDLYLARVAGRLLLVGVDVSLNSILRRLGPARLRVRPTPEKVIDWASITSFGGKGGPARLLTASDTGLRRLRPAELADLLEDLGREERRQLLAQLDPAQAADALEEMQAEELGQLLRESDVTDAADLLAHMEPDEAADALRDLSDAEQTELLEAMPEEASGRLGTLLDYDEDRAGGMMTSLLMTATPGETIEDVQHRLRSLREHDEDLVGVMVVDESGLLVDDLTLTDLFLAGPGQRLSDLVGPPWPVTVTADADLDEITERLVEGRHSSVVVVDDEGKPIGRILADDIVDALLPDRGRFRFPRRLS